MQLDKLAIALRPRQGFEAIDLGFRMAAHWARAVWSVWLVVFVPIVLALSFALSEWPWLVALIVWWLKPFFDRWVLHVLSRGVFGQVPRLAETLGAWREIVTPAMFGALISRLWNYARSFTLPVTQLERQTGAAAATRRRLLKQRTGAHALALTLVCVAFEMVALYGLYSIGTLFATDVQWHAEAQGEGFSFSSMLDAWQWTDTALYAAAISVIEPFYVAGGFALYLNRRVLLEGWDVEVSLRRMTQRFGSEAGAMAKLALIGLLGLCAAGVSMTPRAAWANPPEAPVVAADADESASSDDDDEDADESKTGDIDSCPAPYVPQETEAHKQIRAILGEPTYGGERKEMRWKSIATDEPSKPRAKSDPDSLFANALKLLAELLRVVAWIAVGALVIGLIWLIARQWQKRTPRDETSQAPTQLFGLAISPESLPPDIPTAARALLAQGQVREALSLLYRGALSYLVHVRQLSVRRGATEVDVLALARRQLPAEPVSYFEELMPAWVEAAYAGRLPSAERVGELCDRHAATMPRQAAAEAGARAA